MLLEMIERRRAVPLSDLAGRTAVITGAASGIGLALGRRLKAEGMGLVLIDLDAEALDAAAAELGALAIPADVRDAEAMRAAAAQVMERFGHVSLLCSNAGVSKMAGVRRLTAQDWRWVFDVNLFGAVNVVTAFLPALDASPDGGHVLITASLSSLYATRSQAAYAATKYAVAAFGETLAMELQAEGSKVGVSLLCPGPVRTNIAQGYARREARYRTPEAETDAGPDVHFEAFMGAVVESDWSTPEQVADIAIDGVRRGDFWIITHPQLMASVDDRSRAITEASAAMAAQVR